MKEYFERRITYDPKTQNYKVSVPELGLEILADTEMSGIVEMRKEVANYKPKPEVRTDDDRIARVDEFRGDMGTPEYFNRVYGRFVKLNKDARCGGCGARGIEAHHSGCLTLESWWPPAPAPAPAPDKLIP